MKRLVWALALASLFTNCGPDAASQKLADDAEARVAAAVQRIMAQVPDKAATTNYLSVVHSWYQSEVPNTIKLNPKTERIYQAHAEILQEVAANEPKLIEQPAVTVNQAQGIRSGYKKLVDESTANVGELSALANGKTTMSEADQLHYVSELADKQTKQLALVKYFTKRTAAGLAQLQQQETNKKLMRSTWGHD
ncbi:hypothetical protein [Hymenobacter tenuis]